MIARFLSILVLILLQEPAFAQTSDMPSDGLGTLLGTNPKFPPVAPLPPSATGPNGPDLAYGAFQRGFYLTAFDEARKRVEASKDPVAMTLMGLLYAEGLGIRRDLAAAAFWYKAAAERGNRDAMFAYGMMKLNGEGVAKDESGAVLLLNSSAEKGAAAAAYNLGLLALRSTEKGSPDFTTALKRFRQAAEAGNADAKYSLALLLKEGKGGAADPKAAAELFLSAAVDRHTDAMIELAIMHFNGIGMDKNEAEAAVLLRRAAEAGSPVARLRLARLYAAGRGVAADPKQALRWYFLAKSVGLKDDELEDFTVKQPVEVRDAAQKAISLSGLN